MEFRVYANSQLVVYYTQAKQSIYKNTKVYGIGTRLILWKMLNSQGIPL